MLTEKQLIALAKRVGWEGLKSVAYGALLLGLKSLFDGTIKSITKDDYIRGIKKGK